VDDRGVSNSSTIRLFKMTPTNPPPSVAITFPGSNAQFQAGVTITIMATATNFPASVTNVEFFANGRLLGNDSTNPYSLNECCWKSGTYDLVAKASDSFGASAVSLPVRIIVAKEVPGAGDGFWDPAFTAPQAVWPVTSMAMCRSNLYCSAGSDFYYFESPLMKWDRTNWTSLSYSGATLPLLGVYALASDDSALYAAGLSASNTVNVVKWDGSTWQWLGAALDMGSPVCSQETLRPVSLHVMGADLYVGGMFVSIGGDTNMQAIARWNAAGSTWQPAGNGVNGFVFALGHVRDRLVIGGTFEIASGSTTAHHIAMMEGDV